MTTEEEYDDDTNAYVLYEWDCPACGSNYGTDIDPAGEILECDDCGSKIKIWETR